MDTETTQDEMTSSSTPLFEEASEEYSTLDDLEEESGYEEELKQKNEADNKEAVEKGLEKESAAEASQEGEEGKESPPAEEAPAKVEEVEIIEAADGTKVPGSTVFRKKVDGKLTDVSLKSLLDNYSGKIAVQERFAEANTAKQKAEHQAKITQKERDEVVGVVTNFLDDIKGGHIRDAFDHICKLTGQDSQEQWDNYKKAQVDLQQKLAEMSEEELAKADLIEENAYWKRRSESQNKNNEESAKETEINKEIATTTDKLGIDRDTFDAGYNMLVDMKKKGEYTGPIDVRSAANAGWDIATWRVIDQTVVENLPEKAGDSKLYSEILKDTKAHNLSKDDWVALLGEIKAETQKKESSSNLKRKTKAAEKVQPKVAKEEQTNADAYDPLFDYDEEDNEYMF